MLLGKSKPLNRQRFVRLKRPPTRAAFIFLAFGGRPDKTARMEFSNDDGRLRIDPACGVLRELSLKRFPRPLLDGEAGLFDVALPLPDDLPHRLRVDERQ